MTTISTPPGMAADCPKCGVKQYVVALEKGYHKCAPCGIDGCTVDLSRGGSIPHYLGHIAESQAAMAADLRAIREAK